MSRARIHLIAPASILNKGDAAIYIGAINLITKYLPKCDLSISIEGYGESSGISRMFDSGNLILCKGLLQGIKNSFIRESDMAEFGGKRSPSTRFLSRLPFLRFLYGPLALAQINKCLKLESEPFNSISESDGAVILGHNLEDSTLPMYLFNYAVPKLLFNKKTIIFPMSISALQNGEGLSSVIHESHARFILKQMDYIVLREKFSFDFLKQKLHVNNTVLAADTAFFLHKENCQETLDALYDQGIEIKKPALAVCVRGEGYFQNYGKYIHVSYSSFIRHLAKILDDLISKLDIDVYFVPMTIYPHINFDRYDHAGALLVFKEMRHKSKAHIINTWDMTPSEIASLIEHMDFVLTMRMHQAIMAAIVGVPSALILPAEDNKALGIMKSLGLDDYFIDLGLPPTQIYRNISEKVLEGFNNRPVLKRIMDSKLPLIKKKVAVAAKILALEIEQ